MKIKNISRYLFVTATLGLSGTALAAWEATGSLAQWESGGLTMVYGTGSQTGGTVTDGDNDMSFKFDSMSGFDSSVSASNIMITLTEVETKMNGIFQDVYTVGFDLPGAGFTGGSGTTGTLNYELSVINSSTDLLNSARLDSVVVDSAGNVVSSISKTQSSPQLLLLSSTGGSSDGPSAINPQNSLYVHDVLTPNGDFINHVDNQFTTVPEPFTLGMLAIGFLAMGHASRRIMPGSEKLMV